jgi:hypothetical protein
MGLDTFGCTMSFQCRFLGSVPINEPFWNDGRRAALCESFLSVATTSGGLEKSTVQYSVPPLRSMTPVTN